MSKDYELQVSAPKLPEAYTTKAKVPFKQAPVVVELSNLDEKTRKQVKKYDKNNDGVLSNDSSNKELNDAYYGMGLDLSSHITENVTDVKQETDYWINYNFDDRERKGKVREEIPKTVLTYEDGHTTEIKRDLRYREIYDYYGTPHEFLDESTSRVEEFNNGFTQETTMDKNYSYPKVGPKIKIQNDVKYKGEPGFTETTVLNDDGTSAVYYTRGSYHVCEEYDYDDPHGVLKSDDFKQVLVIKDKDGNVVKTIKNNAQCGKDIDEFRSALWHNKIIDLYD